MKVVRRGIFETNSSSTHAMTICTKEEHDKWKKGEMYYYEEQLITPEENDKILRNHLLDDLIERDYNKHTITLDDITYECKDWEGMMNKIEELKTPERLNKITPEEIETYRKAHREECPQTYKEYEIFLEYEPYSENYISPSGDKLVIFGYSGYDG